MSAQLLVAGAGAAIGSFTPLGPAGGWAVGSAVGGILFAPDLPEIEGQRLEDLTVQASNYGASIPTIYGTRIIAGQIIWKTDIKETKHEEEVSSGKGGGQSQTAISYTYSLSFAVGFCEGEIDGISRIFADGKLIFDFSSDASFTEINAIEAENRRGDITIYTGTETQTADPVIESFEGSGNVPGFRGLAYIVFDDMQLADYGNRLPNITAEIVDNGSTALKTAVVEDAFGVYAGPDWKPVRGRCYVWDGIVEILINSRVYPDARVRSFDWDGNQIDDIQAGEGAAAAVQGATGVNAVLQPVNATSVGGGLSACTLACVAYRQSICGNQISVAGAAETGDCTDPSTNNSTFAIPTHPNDPTDKYKYSGFTVGASGNESYLFYSEVLGGSTNKRIIKYFAGGSAGVTYDVNVTNVVGHDLEVGVQILEAAGQGNSCIAFESNGTDCWYGNIGSGGQLQHFTWDQAGNFTQQNTWSGFGFGEPFGDYFWCVADNGVCLAGGTNASDIFIATRIPTVTDSPVTIASIVTNLCERAGLTASDIDVSTLTDSVIGMSIARPSSARTNLLTLQKVGFFDIVELDWKLVFKKRGTASVRTLSRDDMSAAANSPDLTNVINTTRVQEKDLPKVVKVQYLSEARDQQTSEQSVRRIITEATNELSEQLPIVMEDNKARQIAEVILHASWEGREKHNMSLSVKHLDLAPGDVVTFSPENGDPKQARITSAAYHNGQYQLTLDSEELDSYSSEHVGEEVPVREQVVPILGPAEAWLLDLPVLDVNHNVNGLYTAMRGVLPNWPGGQIYKSYDEGINFSPIAVASDAAVVGSVSGVMPDSRTTVWDYASSITVQLKDPTQTLSSSTEAAVYNGANTAVIGVAGRWEVVSFVNATLVGSGEYTLDTFIRGRKGTIDATPLHEDNDTFILLTATTVDRIYVNFEEYLDEHTYRAVTLGRLISTATNFTQNYFARAYLPFAPGAVTAQLRSDGQLDITWKHAVRVSGEWLDLGGVTEDETIFSYDVFVYQTSDDSIVGFANVIDDEFYSFTTLLGDRQSLTYIPQKFLETVIDGSTEYFFIQEETDVSDGTIRLRNVATNGVVSTKLSESNQAKWRGLGDTLYRGLIGFGPRDSIRGLDTSVSTDLNGAFTYGSTETLFQEICVGGGFVWGIEATFDDQLVKMNPDLTEVTRYTFPAGLQLGGSYYLRSFEGNSTHLMALNDFDELYIFDISGGTWGSAISWPSSSGVPRQINPTATGFLIITDYKTALNENAGWRLYNNAGTLIREQLETTTYPDQGIGVGETPGGEHNWVFESGTRMMVNKVESDNKVYEIINTATGAAVSTIPRDGYTEIVEITPGQFINKYWSDLEFVGTIGTGSLESFVFVQTFTTDSYVIGDIQTSDTGTEVFRAKPATSTDQLRIEVHQRSSTASIGRGVASRPVIIG